MSLQIKLNETREAMQSAVKSMRDYGLAETEAREKHEDGKVASNAESFDKAKKEFETLKAAADRLQLALDAEKEFEKLGTVVNQPGRGEDKGKRETAQTPDRKGKIREMHTEAFGAYLRAGDIYEANRRAFETLQDLDARERHALLGTTGNLGGFLVPEDFRAEVVKNLAGYAAVRSAGARVIPCSGQTLVMPSIAAGTDPYSTAVAGAWRQEGSQGTDGSAPALQTQPTFGQERVPVHVWQPAAVVITRELLEDSVVPLDSLIAQLLGETKALDEDTAFINGSGVGQPRGILDYAGASSGPSITVVNSTSSGAPVYNTLIDLMMTQPAQYRQNSVFLTNSLMFGAILKLKDSSQMPIMYANAMPDTLFGKKVYFSEFVPTPASSSLSLVFGDFRFYCVAERTDLRLQRLDERFAPNVAYLATARLGGAVLRTAAFKAYKLTT